jgi:hypothetical protein
MSKSIVIALAVLVVLVAVYLMIRPSDEVRDRPFSSPVTDKATEGEFSFLKGDFDRIQVERWKPERHYSFLKTGNGWRIFDGEGSEGKGYRLNTEDFETLYSGLKDLKVKAKEVSRNPVNQYRYGVDDPSRSLEEEGSEEGKDDTTEEEESFDIQELLSQGQKIDPKEQSKRGTRLTFWNNNDRQGSIMIGEPIPGDMRDRRQFNRSQFVRSVDSPVVYEMKDNISFLLRKDLKGWRDKKLMHIADSDEIDYLEVKSPEKHFILAQSGEEWNVSDLLSERSLKADEVDESKITPYLGRFGTWTTSDFASEEEYAEIDFEDRMNNYGYHILAGLASGDTLEVRGVAGPPEEREDALKSDTDEKPEPEHYYFVNPKYPDTVYKLRKWSLRSIFDKEIGDFEMEKQEEAAEQVEE